MTPQPPKIDYEAYLVWLQSLTHEQRERCAGAVMHAAGGRHLIEEAARILGA